MGTKRKREASPGSPALFSNKMRTSIEARVDPTYGQRNALPGLDSNVDPVDEDIELSYEDDGALGIDALSYLRSVRQEASNIPNLLVASDDSSVPPKPSLEQGMYDVRYEDGTYFSTSIDHATREHKMSSTLDLEYHGASTIDSRNMYYESFLNRFESLRASLSSTPPTSITSALSHDHPTEIPRLTTPICRKWRYRLRTLNPLPAQLACMDKQTILRALSLLVMGNLIKKGKEIDKITSRWVWGLLARLPGRGELMSEEIGVVRELGKRAVLVAWGLRESAAGEGDLERLSDNESEGADMKEDESEDSEISDQVLITNSSPVHGGSVGLIGPRLPSDPKSVAEQANRMKDLVSVGQDSDTNIEDAKVTDLSAEMEAQSEEMTTNSTPNDDVVAAKARLLARLNRQSLIKDSTSFKHTIEGAHAEITTADQDSKLASKTSVSDDQYVNNPDARVDLGTSANSEGMEDEKKKKEHPKDYNTQATIDMIITIVGESYGQRDLLEFRGLWSTSK